MSTKHHEQIRLYEREFLNGLLEGQTRKPTIFWCKCMRFVEDVPVCDPKCKECGGMGYVYRG